MLENEFIPIKVLLAPPELTAYLGLAFRDKILFPGNKNHPEEIEKTAAHELGHHYLRLDEPLCYAFGEFYDFTHGKLSMRDIQFELAKNNDQRYGYLQGLRIVHDAVIEAVRRRLKPEEVFWDKARQLAKKKEHKWN